MIKEAILRNFRYNRWADQTLLSAVPEHLLDKEAVSSFSTLRQTWFHKWDAEIVWADRLQKAENPRWPFCTNLNMEWNELCSQISISQSEFIQWLYNQPESRMHEELVYRNLKGIEYKNTHEQVLSHLVNHGTFHRGQIVTQLRALGVSEIPSTDMIAYYRLNHG